MGVWGYSKEYSVSGSSNRGSGDILRNRGGSGLSHGIEGGLV